MKKIKYLLAILACLIITPKLVMAGSGTITVSGSSTAIVGNKVTVTVKIYSSAGLGSWQMNLNYDKNYLQLTSATSEAGGTIMASSVASSIKSKSYTYTFKALKKGSTSISVGSYQAFAFTDLSEINLSSTGKNIKILTQEELEASYSKNNDLKSLSIEGFEITPNFSSDVTSYSIVVPEDTKEINVIAKPSDSKSNVTGDGNIAVSSGTNTINVVVKAENGSEKQYTINVEVKDSNPIVINIDNKDYSIVKIKESLIKPETYEETIISIKDTEIPAYYNDNVKLTLIGLKDSEGTISLYSFNNDTYEKYIEMQFGSLYFMPLKTAEKVTGYVINNETINDIEVSSYKHNNDSRYSVIYGVNLENGEKGFYMYDKITKTLMLYNTEYIEALIKQNNLFMYIIIAFCVILVLLFIVILNISKKKKNNKKQKKENNNNNNNDNEIIELSNKENS